MCCPPGVPVMVCVLSTRGICNGGVGVLSTRGTCDGVCVVHQGYLAHIKGIAHFSKLQLIEKNGPDSSTSTITAKSKQLASPA